MDWKVEERAHCWAVVDEVGQDVVYVDKEPRFYNGEPCGSVTSRGRTAEQLAAIAALIASAPRLVKENERLRAVQKTHNQELREMERDFQREAREIAAEERWKIQQGDEYGSY